MKYAVYAVEASTTKTGKSLKKLVLQGEGKQYPDKNVTMWSDHPLFNSIAPGQGIDVELDVKDSTVPNPHGGFYKNKTVIGRSDSPAVERAKEDSPAISVSQLFNLVNLKVLPTLDRIERMMDKLGEAMDPNNPSTKIDRALDEAYPDDSAPFN